jgi:hypothetical protein
VGFKLLYSHARVGKPQAIWQYLSQMPDLKVITLQRDNLLHSYVSLEVAYRTNEFIVLDPKRPRPKIKLTIDETHCREYFQKIQKWQREAARLFKNTPQLKISYEDLVTHQDKNLQKVQTFLGVPVRELHCAVQKQNKRPMRDIITNYSALKKAFAKTKWQAYFNE